MPSLLQPHQKCSANFSTNSLICLVTGVDSAQVGLALELGFRLSLMAVRHFVLINVAEISSKRRHIVSDLCANARWSFRTAQLTFPSHRPSGFMSDDVVGATEWDRKAERTFYSI
jgi:hypothetical protein